MSTKNGDVEIYRPSLDKAELECNDKAYKSLISLELDYPSQSICTHNNFIVFGNMASADFKSSKLCFIHKEDFENENLRNINEYSVNFYINRMISLNNKIILVGDNNIATFESGKFTNFENSEKFEFGFGLCKNNDSAFVTTKNGLVLEFNDKLELKQIHKISDKALEAVAIENGNIFTGDLQGNIMMNDILLYKNDCDINTISVNGGILIFGDDKGRIGIINGDKCVKIEKWHHSPIERVVFLEGTEEFWACSEEQVSMWDLSFENEEQIVFDIKMEFKRVKEVVTLKNNEIFLNFVHQGHFYYKDISFLDRKVITTSEKGLCMFEPIMNEEDIESSSETE